MPKTKLPQIPQTPISDPKLREIVDSVRQILTARAHGKERWVTFNDLVDIGALNVTKDGQYYPPNEPPPNTPPTPTPSPTPPTPPPSTGAPPGVKCMYPPAPTNVTATGMFEGVFLDWDVIPYPYRLTHDVAEIFRGEKDDVQLAALVGTGVGTSYWDAIKTPGKTYYYWVRFKNLCGERGPYQGTHGVKAKVLFPSSYLIGLLSDDITMSRLYGDLGSRIISIEDDSSKAASSAATALTRVGYKSANYWQATTPIVPPGGHKIGDLWVETDNNNFLWVWNGTTWVDGSDQRIGAYAQYILQLRASLNGWISGMEWRFDTPSGWIGTNAFIDYTPARFMAVTATGSPSYITSPYMYLNGAEFTKIRIGIRREPGSTMAAGGRLGFRCAGYTDWNGTDYADVPVPTWRPDNTAIIELDMAQAHYGPVPWTQSYIWQLRLQLTFTKGGATAYYEIDWLSCGKVAVAGESVLLEQNAEVWADPIHGLAGQYTVKIDNGGYVSGFGLSSEAAVNANPTSSFIVRADRFAIGPEAGPTWVPTKAYAVGDTCTWAVAPTPPETAWVRHVYQCIVANTGVIPTINTHWVMLDGQLPFIVTTANTQHEQDDGTFVTVGPGVYMNRAFIHDAFIDNAMIGSAAITDAKIANATITSAKISELDATKIVSRSITADKIAAQTITANEINSRGLTIQDYNGNIILGVGTPLQVGYISGLGQWATLQGQITANNISTFIASAAIGDAYIGNTIQSINPPFSGTTGWRIDKNGNITINNLVGRGTLQSGGLIPFVPNVQGWQIRNDGDAEFHDVTIRGGLVVRNPLPDAHGPFSIPFGTSWGGGTFYHNTGKIPMVAATSENPDYSVSISSVGAISFQITITPSPTTDGTMWLTYW